MLTTLPTPLPNFLTETDTVSLSAAPFLLKVAETVLLPLILKLQEVDFWNALQLSAHVANSYWVLGSEEYNVTSAPLLIFTEQVQFPPSLYLPSVDFLHFMPPPLTWPAPEIFTLSVYCWTEELDELAPLETEEDELELVDPLNVLNDFKSPLIVSPLV